MNRTQSAEPGFLAVTSAGAYFAVAAGEVDPDRTLILNLLAEAQSPLEQTLNMAGDPTVSEQLSRLKARGWLANRSEADSAPRSTLEALLPVLLPDLSDRGRALLADHQGLAIGLGGFSEHEAQGLAALSADALALARRAAQLLPHFGSHLPGSWAMVDAAGNSRVGVWPIHLPGRQFTLVIEGRPLFVRVAFQQLVWTLVRRYGVPSSPSTGA